MNKLPKVISILSEYKELNLNDQVIFLKNITEELKNALVSKSNLFVMPSIVHKKIC